MCRVGEALRRVRPGVGGAPVVFQFLKRNSAVASHLERQTFLVTGTVGRGRGSALPCHSGILSDVHSVVFNR